MHHHGAAFLKQFNCWTLRTLEIPSRGHSRRESVTFECFVLFFASTKVTLTSLRRGGKSVIKTAAWNYLLDASGWAQCSRVRRAARDWLEHSLHSPQVGRRRRSPLPPRTTSRDLNIHTNLSHSKLGHTVVDVRRHESNFVLSDRDGSVFVNWRIEGDLDNTCVLWIGILIPL